MAIPRNVCQHIHSEKLSVSSKLQNLVILLTTVQYTAKGIKVRLYYAYLYTGSYTTPTSTQLQSQPKCPPIGKLKNFKCGIRKMQTIIGH